MNHPSSDCKRFEGLVALHVEGDLPADEIGRLASHLAICSACRALAEELETSQRALRIHMHPPFDEEVLAQIRADVLAQVVRPRALPFRRRVRKAAPWLAAAATLLVAIGLWRFSGEPSPQTAPAPVEALSVGAPTVEAPTVEAPTVEAPTVEAPTVEAPTVEEPSTPPPRSPRLQASPVEETRISTLAPKLSSPPREAWEAPAEGTEAGSLPSEAFVESEPRDPTLIKIVSEEKNLVIYWLVDPAATKENSNERSKVL